MEAVGIILLCLVSYSVGLFARIIWERKSASMKRLEARIERPWSASIVVPRGSCNLDSLTREMVRVEIEVRDENGELIEVIQNWVPRKIEIIRKANEDDAT